MLKKIILYKWILFYYSHISSHILLFFTYSFNNLCLTFLRTYLLSLCEMHVLKADLICIQMSFNYVTSSTVVDLHIEFFEYGTTMF